MAGIRMKIRITAHLDGGHDVETVALTFVSETTESAKRSFTLAMEQLGFKRSDYGHMHLTIYA
ncbi:hypothetical protein ACQZ6C_10815 [Rhizobium rhizogenes]